MTELELERLLDYYLDREGFAEFLERFNITPLEALVCLFESGLIDEELLSELTPSDSHFS